MADYDFLNHVNLHGHQIVDAIGEQLDTAPGGKADGHFYYDTTLSQFQFKQNGAYTGVGGSLSDDTNPQLAAPLKSNAHQFQQSIGSDVASQASLLIPADGNYFTVTGTNDVDGIDTIAVGVEIELHFAAILNLGHNASSFILPTATDITTAAGDVVRFREISIGNWKCTGYVRADGTSLVGGGGSSLPFSDATAHISDAADATKLIRFDAGEIATGNTRTMQAPNADAKVGLSPIERSFYAAGGALVTDSDHKILTVKRPFRLMDLQVEIDANGTADVQVRIKKNGTLVGVVVALALAGNSFDYGLAYQGGVAFAAGDLMELNIVDNGDVGSGATAASGPLDVTAIVCYDPD